MFCTTCGAAVPAGASYCGACGTYLNQPPPEASGPPTAPTFGEAEPGAPVDVGGRPDAAPMHAGFWLRAGALVLDTMILIGVAMVFAVSLIAFDAALLVEQGTARAAMRELAGGVFSWLYYALMESSSLQATVGKRALGLRVTDLAGQRISFARATGRHFGKILSTVTFGIGYLMAAFTDRRQTLHDMVAGCVVVINRPT